MKYLSLDLEATGLDEDCLIIEFACVPFDSFARKIENDLSFHCYVKCPSFEELKDNLNLWVVENNKQLIQLAHQKGLEHSELKKRFENYLEQDVKDYFGGELITIFGKSLNAIDLPFLNRDLGWDFMRKYFNHRQLDLSSFVYGLIDMKVLTPEMESGTALMNFLGMGDVCHTALEDSINTAKMYLKLLEICDQN